MQRILTTVLVALTLLGGFAMNPPKKNIGQIEQYPDSLRKTYLYTDGIKQLVIYNDSLKARENARLALDIDSLYAPAQYLTARSASADNIDEAIYFARKAYESDRDNVAYLSTLAYLSIRAQQYNDAIEYFSTLTQKDTDPDNFRILSLLYSSDNQPFEAIKTLDSAEVKIGRQPMLVRFRQKLYINTKQFEKAEEEAKCMIAETPYLAESHIALADVYSAMGRDSLALISLKNAIQTDSLYVDAWGALSDFYYDRHDYSNYLSALGHMYDSKEIPLDRKISQVTSLMGNVRFYREYYPQINMLIGKLVIHYPDDERVTELYAKQLIASGQIEAALSLYKQNLNETTSSISDFRRIIEIESYLGRNDSVAVYLKKALNRYPQDAEIRAEQGHVNMMSKRYADAIASYKDAVKYARNDTLRGKLWGYIGDAEHELGEKKRAYAAFERALKLYPDNSSVLNNYAYFLSLEGRDLEKALGMATGAVAIASNNPTFLDTMAWVLYRLARYNEAKKYMQQALSFDETSSADMALHYGDILYALGDTFMAKTYWRKALERGYDATEIEQRLNDNHIVDNSAK